jgi:hypothetical protein
MKRRAGPAAFMADRAGWQGLPVGGLRAAIHAGGGAMGRIGWGHLVLASAGPAILVQVGGERVPLGFRRGRPLRAIEPRIGARGRHGPVKRACREGDGGEGTQATALAAPAQR